MVVVAFVCIAYYTYAIHALNPTHVATYLKVQPTWPNIYKSKPRVSTRAPCPAWPLITDPSQAPLLTATSARMRQIKSLCRVDPHSLTRSSLTHDADRHTQRGTSLSCHSALSSLVSRVLLNSSWNKE